MTKTLKRIKKLTYWVAAILDDHPAYNIRARTRKECVDQRNAYGPERFGEVHKVVVTYRDAFSLVNSVLGEGASE